MMKAWFKLSYGPWHRYDPSTATSLCSEEPSKSPGAGTTWASLDVNPTPKCNDCVEALNNSKGKE